MSAGLIALLLSLGSSTWVFVKLRNHTGYGNNQSALAGAAAVFALGFIVLFTLLHMFLH